MSYASFLNRCNYTLDRPSDITPNRWRAMLKHYWVGITIDRSKD